MPGQDRGPFHFPTWTPLLCPTWQRTLTPKGCVLTTRSTALWGRPQNAKTQERRPVRAGGYNSFSQETRTVYPLTTQTLRNPEMSSCRLFLRSLPSRDYTHPLSHSRNHSPSTPPLERSIRAVGEAEPAAPVLPELTHCSQLQP